MSDEIDLRPIFENTHNGAGIWGTFRWLTNLVYAACWVVALPAELVLNRKMGPRYAGLLPLTVAFFIVGTFFALPAAYRPSWGPQTADPMAVLKANMALLIAEGVFFLAVLRNRFANWLRFRSDEQVHSLSNGIPFWLNPPRFASARIAESSPTVQSVAVGKGGTTPNAALMMGHVSSFVKEWLSGQPPTGPITWFLATVVHPALLSVGGVYLYFVSPVAAYYLFVAGIMIFLKARIQKALVVEKVYDIFDSRLEHEFTQALGNPVKVRKVERAGMIVPGIATVLARGSDDTGTGRGPIGPEPSPLPPDLQSLLRKPKSDAEVEPKQAPKAATAPVDSSHSSTLSTDTVNAERDRVGNAKPTADSVGIRRDPREVLGHALKRGVRLTGDGPSTEQLVADFVRHGFDVEVKETPEGTVLCERGVARSEVGAATTNGSLATTTQTKSPPIASRGTEASASLLKQELSAMKSELNQLKAEVTSFAAGGTSEGGSVAGASSGPSSKTGTSVQVNNSNSAFRGLSGPGLD